MSGSDRDEGTATKLKSLVIAAALAALALIGGVIWGSVEQARYQWDAESRIADYAQHASGKVARACHSIPSDDKAICVSQAQNEYELQTRDNQRNEYDLVAQRRSALWTTIMGIAALVGMALSAIGVGLIWTTFQETKRTADAAHDANDLNRRALETADKRALEAVADQDRSLKISSANANAAQRAALAASESNSIAQEAMRLQLRPFLYVGKPIITYQNMLSFNIIGDIAQFFLVCRNYGQTPARNVRILARGFIGGIWNEPFEADLSNAAVIHLADIPPKDFKERRGFSVSGLEQAHTLIGAGSQSVFVEGVVNYEDGFGETYATSFRYASTAEEFADSMWSETPGGNSAT